MAGYPAVLILFFENNRIALLKEIGRCNSFWGGPVYNEPPQKGVL
jgi:hypothetical protein